MRSSSCILAALLTTACSDLAPRGLDVPAEMDHSTFAPVALTGDLVAGDGLLGLPTRVQLVGNRAVVLDGAADSSVHVLDARTGSLVRSFGRRGGGPGEYEGAWSLASVPGSEDGLWIWDISLRRLTHVDLSRPLEAGEALGDSSVNVYADVPLMDPTPMGDRWVALGFLEEARLAYFDEEGRPLGVGGPLPPGDDELPASVRQQVNQSYLAAKPDRSRLAVATRHFDRLEIYRADGSLVVRKTGPFGFEPYYEVRLSDEGKAGMASGGDLRFGYVGLAVTDQRIYALFSGRTRVGFPGQANFGEYVHVYDWDANLLGVLKLDAAAIAIDVSPTDDALYAIRHEPTPALVRYPIDARFGDAPASLVKATDG